MRSEFAGLDLPPNPAAICAAELQELLPAFNQRPRGMDHCELLPHASTPAGAAVTTIIRGVTLLRQHIHADSRGELVALEQQRNLPFELKRVFFMKVDSPENARGGHANSCDEFIMALSGSVRIEVDNGFQHARVRLAGHDRALWIRAGILIHLREFEPGTILLVCASELYADTHHFNRAQPQLMMADCPA